MPKGKQLMEIEVTFGNRSDYVVVYHGDDPYDLAKAFVRKHKLKESSINPICDYIEATIDEYLIANPDKDRRNTSDSNDSSFDYDNVPMRYHNPIVEVVEQPKPKDKQPTERARLNSGDKQNNAGHHNLPAASSSYAPSSSSGHGHAHANSSTVPSVSSHVYGAHGISNENAHSSSHNIHGASNTSTAPAAKTPIPKQSGPPSPTNRVKHEESDLVRLAKQALNAPDTAVKPPASVAIQGNEPERKNSTASNPRSDNGSATSTTPPVVDVASAHIRQSPLRIRGSESEFFLETKGQTQPEQASTYTMHAHQPTHQDHHRHSLHKSHPNNISGHGHGHGHGGQYSSSHNHHQQRSPDGFEKSMRYSASDLDLLSSLEDPNAVDHRQFQANLDRNMNSSLSNFSYRKMATEIVSSSRTPSVTSEYSTHSRASNAAAGSRRHFGDGRSRLQKRSPTQQQGIALHSEYPLHQQQDSGDDDNLGRGGSDYEVDEVEYDPNRSGNSNDSVLGIKDEGGHHASYQGQRRHSRGSAGQLQPFPTTLDPSVNGAGGGGGGGGGGCGVNRRGKRSPVRVRTANERLYMSATALKQKQLMREQQAARQLKEELEKNQFKLNEASRKMVQRMSVKSNDGDHVGVRLYAEGVKEKQMKLKRAENMKGISVCEEWSCAKCGKFHKITTANVVIQPLSQAESSTDRNNASQLQNKVVKICTCGWDQGAVESFKPINVGLKLHEDAEVLTYNRRHTREGIHEQLHNEARERDRIRLVDQAVHQEAVIQSMFSFTPQIPDSSRAIVENYVAASSTSNGPNTSSSDGRSLSASRRSGAFGGSSRSGNAIVGPQLGEYFSVPAVERLSRTKTREIDEFHTLYKQSDRSLSRSQSRSRSRSRSMSRSRTTTAGASTAAGEESSAAPTKKDKFIERLVYEYKEKAEKVKDLAKSVYSHDPVTGQPLFQPVVPVLPADLYHVPPPPPTAEEAKGKKQQEDFVKHIMQRDHELKMKKLKAQKEAELKELELLKTSKAKALETSDAILKAATDRNIDDLFHLLTMQNTVATDENQQVNANNSGDDWRGALVDLQWVNMDVMIDEVSNLLSEIRNERLSQLQKEGKIEAAQTQKLLVNMDDFRKLALKCIKKRDVTGKRYVYAPKKKPEVALQMIKKEQEQETFRPRMDKTSLELSRSRKARLTEEPIELILQQEGDKLKSKVEIARQELILKQSAELTFQPRMYKAPAYVQPRYRGMDSLGSSTGGGDGGNDVSFMLDSELASASQGSRSGGGSSSNVINANDFLRSAVAAAAVSYPPPPPLPSEVAEQQLQSVRGGLQTRPQPSTDYIPIQKPNHVTTTRPHQHPHRKSSGSTAAAAAPITPISAGGGGGGASISRVSSDEVDEEFTVSTTGLDFSPHNENSINMSVSASSHSNSYAPRRSDNFGKQAPKPITPGKKKTAATSAAAVTSTAKSGKKPATKPLPLLPFEALASYGGESDLRRSSGGGGGMTIAELRKVATNRLSVDSGLTHSTSSTVVKKKK